MSEWWTYSLSDFLMFSPRTYWRVVADYLRELWPAHLVAWLAAIASAGFARRRPRLSLSLLAAVWLWVGWAFFWDRLGQIDLAAPWWAAACAAQAALLLASRTPPRAWAWLAFPLPETLALATVVAVRRWWLGVIPAALLAAWAALHCVMAGACR
jgi:hypothetical protein